MTQRRRRIKTYFQFLITLFVLVALDQWTKLLAVQHLQNQEDISLIPGVLSLHYLENRGAAFGIFQEQKIFLILLPLLILCAVCYVLWKLPEEKKYFFIKLLCFFIAAGGVGNLIDRIRLNYVVDFIYFSLIDFPVFNVADIYVTVSVFFLILLTVFYYKDEDFRFLKFGKSKSGESDKEIL